MAPNRYFTDERFMVLREHCRRYMSVKPAEPAKLGIDEVVFLDREQAYAFAIEIMNRADETWPRR